MTYSTPRDLVRYLNKEHGPFTLDVAASADNAVCDRYYVKEQDGLVQPWTFENVWCNPEYGDRLYSWVRKAFLESRKGATVTCLLPAYTESPWFHEIVLKYSTILYFIQGRVTFGKCKTPGVFPSIVAVFDFRVRWSTPIIRTLDYRRI